MNKTLNKLGFTPQQAAIYCMLLQSGLKLEIMQIAKLSKIAYKVCSKQLKLMEKYGVVSSWPGKTISYSAVPIENIKQIDFSRRELLWRQTFKSLQQTNMRREKLTSYHIQYVYSKQKIHESLIELVHLAKKQVLVISFFADKDWDFLNTCDRLINKGVEVRFVTKHGIITRRDLNNLAGVKISFVEEFLFGIAIVDQKYLLLNIDNGTGLENLALFTKDKLFINNLTNYFNDVFDQKHDPYGL